MDQKKQFLLLIGALAIIIVLIIVVPGPNFGQINLLSNSNESATTNLLQDPTLSLGNETWERSTSAYQNTVDTGGLHTLKTSSTGLILSQKLEASAVSNKQKLTMQGSLISTTERDTFFVSLRDSQNNEIFRSQVSPMQPFSLEKSLSNTERSTVANGGVTLQIELPGNATYVVGNLALSGS